MQNTVTSILRQAEREHWTVRAASIDGDTTTGRVSIGPVALRIDNIMVSIDSIQVLERLELQDPWRSAKWGALVGAAGGLALLVPLCVWGTESGCNEAGRLVLTSATVGAVVGALTGGLFSRAEWIPLWPPPSER